MMSLITYSLCKVAMKSKIQPTELGVAFGISRRGGDFNGLDLPVSFIRNFTKHFCSTIWSYSSNRLSHDDDDDDIK